MDDNRIRTALGFAMRAGKCISGDFACERAVKDHKAFAVALDSLVSQATREKYVRICERANVPLVFITNLGRAIGKDNRMTAAVTDAAFAEMIKKAIDA